MLKALNRQTHICTILVSKSWRKPQIGGFDMLNSISIEELVGRKILMVVNVLTVSDYS